MFSSFHFDYYFHDSISFNVFVIAKYENNICKSLEIWNTLQRIIAYLFRFQGLTAIMNAVRKYMVMTPRRYFATKTTAIHATFSRGICLYAYISYPLLPFYSNTKIQFLYIQYVCKWVYVCLGGHKIPRPKL